MKAQKASPFATAAQNEMMMNLFQMGAFNPQAADATLVMLDGMTFEGKEKLIEKSSRIRPYHRRCRNFQTKYRCWKQ